MKILREYGKRVIVAGSRSYNDYEAFEKFMLRYVQWVGKKDLAFITGDAKEGADAMIIRFCEEHKYEYFKFPALWRGESGDEPYNPKAGFERNTDMRDACTSCIVFYDLISNGSADMIDKCMEYPDLQTLIVVVKPDEGYYERKLKLKQKYK